MSCRPLLNMVMFYCRPVPFVVTIDVNTLPV